MKDQIMQSTQLSQGSTSKSINLDTNRYKETTKEATYNLLFPSSACGSPPQLDTNRIKETSKEALYNLMFSGAQAPASTTAALPTSTTRNITKMDFQKDSVSTQLKIGSTINSPAA